MWAKCNLSLRDDPGPSQAQLDSLSHFAVAGSVKSSEWTCELDGSSLLDVDAEPYWKQVCHCMTCSTRENMQAHGLDQRKRTSSLGKYSMRTQKDVRAHCSTDFQFGRVFKVVWSEPGEQGDKKRRDASIDRHLIRRFVITGNEQEHYICIPVATYSSQNVNKGGVHTDSHGTIYASNKNGRKGEGAGALGQALKDDTNTQNQCSLCRANYDKTYAVDHSLVNFARRYKVNDNTAVSFTGRLDEINMKMLLAGERAWEQSDTGKAIPVIIEPQFYPSCPHGHGQSFQTNTTPNKMLALLGLSSGLLMSSSSVWLNTRMGLYEPSPSMSKIMDWGAQSTSHRMYTAALNVPDSMTFAFFILGTAGLTSASVTHLRRSRNQTGFILALTFLGLFASVLWGFNAEELFLVCLPLISGCLIFCTSVLGRKGVDSMDREEKVQLSEV